MNMQMNAGMSIVRTALWIVGIFTLLSGIVGVSNIMLISVKERTREFGIRKAIGAKPRNILYLIIVESIIITTFFGYIGMLLGIAANQYMDATIGQEAITMGSGKAIHTFESYSRHRCLYRSYSGYGYCRYHSWIDTGKKSCKN